MIYAIILFVTASGPVEAYRSTATFDTMAGCKAVLTELHPHITTHATRLSLRLRADVRADARCVHQGRPA